MSVDKRVLAEINRLVGDFNVPLGVALEAALEYISLQMRLENAQERVDNLARAWGEMWSDPLAGKGWIAYREKLAAMVRAKRDELIRLCRRSTRGATIEKLAIAFKTDLGYSINRPIYVAKLDVSRIVNKNTGYPYEMVRTHTLPAN